jgi:hypothetical protein
MVMMTTVAVKPMKIQIEEKMLNIKEENNWWIS